jgi:hypothetical protein
VVCSTKSSKLAGPGSPRLGRFDSFAASLRDFPAIVAALVRPLCLAGATRVDEMALTVQPAALPELQRYFRVRVESVYE